MKICIRNRCEDFASYRCARVKSMFNPESGNTFDLDVDLPIDDTAWKLGAVVGPSGSGKSSIGRALFGGGKLYAPVEWPEGLPVIDAIAPEGDFDRVTAALSAVGLGSVPAWLRPYSVLSNGERFRADLARIVCDRPAQIVVDEFTSVVDRQIARVGAFAFARAWRRTGGQCVVLSCHHDILEWLAPDWTFDTGTLQFDRGLLWRRPPIALSVYSTNWSYWKIFEPHHYLKAGPMPFSGCYVGFVAGEPVCHLGMSSKNLGKGVEARACRLVVMPEWQGAGVGLRFLNYVSQLQLEGRGRLAGRKVTTLFHTSHPALCAALRRDQRWRQVSCNLFGANKLRSQASLARSGVAVRGGGGYGGHFRAVQGFRYYG